MKKSFLTFGLMVAILGGAFAVFHSGLAHAAFNSNDIIDDAIYNNVNTMNSTAINTWLNANFPSSCISTHNGFSTPDPTGYSPSSGYTYGPSVSAGQAIYDSAAAYGLNPQVLLATLQKEESLVGGGSGCSVSQYASAVGYGCPDSGGSYSYSGVNLYSTGTVFDSNFNVTHAGTVVSAINNTCVNSSTKVGFSEQVIHAAWLLKYGQQRSEGNTAWDVQATNFPQPGDSWNNSDDPPSCYGGPMTQGSFKRCSTDTSPVFYDGYTTIDGVRTHMDTGATAALYWYTPHFSGNQNFYNLFSTWFGSPNSSCRAIGNLTGTKSGDNIIAYQTNASQPTNYALILQNNTGSGCVEEHTLSSSAGQSWLSHITTGMRATDPSTGQILSFKPRGSKTTSNLLYIAYGDASTNVSVHEFSPDLQTFPGYYDASTNLSGITAASGMFVAGDFLGRGYDQVAFVLYSGGSGHVEVHLFDPTLQKAIGYYDVPTNLTGITAASGTFVAGDFLGRGYDQLAFVLYNGSSGRVEVHLFDPTLQRGAGYYDVPTNLTGITAASGTFIAGDFLGRGYDQLAFMLYNGSSGRVEVHLFDPTLQRGAGYYDSPTIVSPIDPSQ